jgi:hypothetical protein
MTLTADELSALKKEKYHIAPNNRTYHTYKQSSEHVTNATLVYLSYAYDLAKALQVRMAADQNFNDIIQRTTLDVHEIAERPLSDDEFHKGCQFLVYTWEHGPELYQWHKETFPPWNRLMPSYNPVS